jgi:hypothetical protein
VAKIKSTSPAAREAFRQKLNPAQQATFDQLSKHFGYPGTDLGWYHRLGMLLHRLVPDTVPDRGRVAWLQKNAETLGPGKSLLQKAYRFYELYPQQQDLLSLQALGTTWTSVYIAFAVKDRAARHNLLGEALKKKWTPGDLRAEVQRRYPSGRHGMGGRPKSKQRTHGPEAALRGMERSTSRWLDFHGDVWSEIKPARWTRFIRRWPSQDRDTLRQLLRDANDRLKVLIREAQEVRRTVAVLSSRVGKA